MTYNRPKLDPVESAPTEVKKGISGFKKGIYIVLAGGFLAATFNAQSVYSAAATLVQIVLAGNVPVSSTNPLPVNVVAGGGTGGTSSTFGAAFPATGTAIGASDGTNMQGLLVDGSGNLKVNIITGGGGSQTDASTWTTAVTGFVPNGGVFNDSAAVLSSGKQGTVRLNAHREMHVDVDTTNNNLYAAITAPVPDCGATPCTNKIGVVGVNTWGGSTLGAGSNYGTSPGAVVVPGFNAFITNTVPVTLTSTTITGNSTVIGPTADGSAASTAPVLVAGTTDGTATGLVATPKVSAGGLVSTDGSAVTQPVSAVSLPLPSGAATSALQGTDPCVSGAKTSIPISITTATTTNILVGTAAVKTYVCHLLLTSAAADNVAVIQGTTGGTCGSGTLGLVGGVTAANGLNFAANGGVNFGNGGAQVLQTTVNNNDICLITSASTPLAGTMTYVKQ